MSNPDQLEHDIDRTRGSLRDNVGRFNDKASPSKAVSRRIDRMRDSAGTIKEKVMGYADNSDGGASAAAKSAASSVQDATSAAAAKLGDATGNAPQAVREQTQGNPLGAGVIAFGVGWLLSALVPASEAEQHAAQQLEDNAGAMIEPLKDSAQEVTANLKQPLQKSAESVKGTADDASRKTGEHARSAAEDVRGQSSLGN